jgi:serine/threonine protein phosphatase 1
MKKSRLIAIGDIHGEIKKLNSLLKKINPIKEDTLVFLGDYIDKGQHSKEVIERLLALEKQTSCIFLKGNHEDMLCRAYNTRDERDITLWLLNGGMETSKNYGDFEKIFSMHKSFFEKLKPYHLTSKYLFVHAGLDTEKSLQMQDENNLLYVRFEFINKPHSLSQKIIFGHTPFEVPLIQEDKIGIDTGCGAYDDGKLCAFICNKEEFIFD